MSSKRNLVDLGWNEFFARSFQNYAAEGYLVGRVALEQKEVFRLLTAEGDIWGELSGRLRYRAQGRHELPAIGDWVVIKDQPNRERMLIHEVLPRRTKFS